MTHVDRTIRWWGKCWPCAALVGACFFTLLAAIIRELPCPPERTLCVLALAVCVVAWASFAVAWLRDLRELLPPRARRPEPAEHFELDDFFRERPG